MTDTYSQFVNHGIGKDLATRLGLPRPAVLRRYEPGQDLLAGPVVVTGVEGGRVADQVRAVLADAGAQVVPVAAEGGYDTTLGGVVFDATAARVLTDLEALRAQLGPAVKALGRNARVLILGTTPDGIADVQAAATQQALEGIMRSIGKELRAGGTANLLWLDADAQEERAALEAPLRFFLSGRSAFVDGQFLTVGDERGGQLRDWDRPVAGKVAVVTGAARGIGAQVARTLAESGATVIVVDVPAAGEGLAALANELHVPALQLDVTDPQAGRRILELAGERYGRLDLVVHNAGITRDKMLANMDRHRWDSVIAVNVESQLRITRTLLESDGLGEHPRIVCLASTSGVAGNRGQTNYAASKAGVIGAVAATAPLIARRGGTINAVAPGFIESEMTAKIPAARRQVSRRLNSLQQGGLPEDVAQAITFLLSDAAGGINGQTLRVCGQNLVGA